MTVYVVQDNGKLDFSPASKWGNLVPLIRGEIYADDPLDKPRAYRDAIDVRIENFDVDKDWVLLTGDPVAIASTILSLVDLGVHHIPCLKWDREMRNYFAVVLPI